MQVKKDWDESVPDPGAVKALEQGCLCEVQDNNYGAGIMWEGQEPAFWVNANCPLHGWRRER